MHGGKCPACTYRAVDGLGQPLVRRLQYKPAPVGGIQWASLSLSKRLISAADLRISRERSQLSRNLPRLPSTDPRDALPRTHRALYTSSKLKFMHIRW